MSDQSSDGCIPLVTFTTNHKGWTEEQFVAKYPYPFLVLSVDSLELLWGMKTMPMEEYDEEYPRVKPGTYVVPIWQDPEDTKEIGIIVLGRAPEADLTITHPLISKVHCFFRYSDEGEYRVQDSESTNGTYVNEERLKGREYKDLKSGDKFGVSKMLTGLYLNASDFYQQLEN